MNRRDALKFALAALAGGASACAGQGAGAQSLASAPPRRIVAMDFGLIEMLLTLGVTPLATSVPDWYRRTNVAPPLPASVIDIGLLYQPNFELLAQLRPDLFVITPAHAPLRAQLERIAPTLTLALSAPGVAPWRQIAAETRRLAQRLAREPAAEAAIASAEASLAQVRQRLAARPDVLKRPVFVVEFVDDRHVLAFGAPSLFGDVMTRVGLANAWTRDTNARGYAMTDFTRLAAVRDAGEACLVYLEPLPDAARATLASGVLWRSLPFARARRVAAMPKVSPGGALYSGARFARQLADALLAEAGHA
ncbi:ABC transporter substrate-binding protein [Paraburkholderia acidisoli]|uniref:ABC transporter substrate-binding protein n=1 Tax=Paraburkholderia acidisoli TaxID=2571748 RepID=A0A7Z2GNT7_9BURK|nr:ABC transporter substrate-binding protein [Paraburkholderia acidisoli]QGZ64991.1 ABC transporter substrate-binding protein [Paraburkholderia acidisoli]